MTVLIELADLTTGALAGTGIFDKLMAATKAHLEAEYAKGRIKGPEYATVYLGALDNVMANATQFLLQKTAVGLQADLLAQQILLAQVEVIKAEAAVRLMEAEILNAAAQRTLIVQQAANAVIEGAVLTATECKLRAEYDVLILSKEKTTTETALLTQKVATEKAQILGLGVDDNSVVGKQKALYTAQTDGFKRNAEHQAASLMVSTWNARRMSDEATVADGTNMLNDPAIGRTINKLLAGVGA